MRSREPSFLIISLQSAGIGFTGVLYGVSGTLACMLDFNSQ